MEATDTAYMEEAVGMEGQEGGQQEGETAEEAATPNAQQIRLAEILARTGYSHDVTSGQHKYGGPPPNWNGETPGKGCEIYCGKIPASVLDDELIPLFEECGTIFDMRLMMDPATGQNRGFCFCTFVDRQGADRAVKQLDGHAIRPNKQLKVNLSNPNCRLFVGNIPKSKSKEDILAEAAKVTDGVQDVIVYSIPDDPKKKNRGFAFLDYESHKMASDARKRLCSGRVFLFGCEIICDWADPQDEPDSETMSKVKVLYVRNLKADVTEEQLRERFIQHGDIEKVKKVKDYGFVHFHERASAIRALEALNGAMINDSKMLISLAKPPVDAKVKEMRKMQHAQLFNGGMGPDPFFGMRGGPRGGGRMMGGRGGMGGAVRPLKMPMRGRGGGMGGPVAFRGMTSGFDAGYYDGYDPAGEGYYEGYDDYSGYGYGGDDYYGEYYGGAGGMGAGFGLGGAPRARGRGLGLAGLRGRGMGLAGFGSPLGGMRARGMRGGGMLRGRGGLGLRGAPGARGRGAGIAFGAEGSVFKVISSGRRPAGRAGANGGGRGGGLAGAKRKAEEAGYDVSETKKAYTDDAWTTQPIAQQPLEGYGGAEGAAGGGGESEWAQDSFGGEQWG